NLKGKIAAEHGTAADRLAGDVAQGKKMAESIVTAGRSVGLSASQLTPLTKLPYHYTDADHKTVASILQALEKQGGRGQLLALTITDYLRGLRTFQSLEVLTAGASDIGVRTASHLAIATPLGKMFGSNRYAILSGLVMSGTDSLRRSSDQFGRMS